MVDWQITAKTIYCDAVDDEATIIVYKDGTVKCTSHAKYAKPDKELGKTIELKQKRLGRRLACEGAQCSHAIQYRDRLFAQEKPAKPK